MQGSGIGSLGFTVLGFEFRVQGLLSSWRRRSKIHHFFESSNGMRVLDLRCLGLRANYIGPGVQTQLEHSSHLALNRQPDPIVPKRFSISG